MFGLAMDAHSEEIVARLYLAEELWSSNFENMAKELAIAAETYFKPLLSVRPDHTGETEASIRHEIHTAYTGFEVVFYGLESANFMDVGNIPASSTISAADYGYRAFPVDKRLGTPFFARTIHGMGSRTPGAPTHWSEKTVERLADGEAMDIAMRHAMEFLRAVG